MNNRRRHHEDRERRRLPTAERLEPRVLYSADALAPFAPLLLDDDAGVERDREDLAALLAEAGSSSEGPVSGDPGTGDVGPGHVVFVDAAVHDAGSVARELRESGARVVVIGAEEDGLVVVSRTLAAESELQAVHLLAHGDEGTLALGTATLDARALESNGIGIARWGDALAAGGDFLLYGCDVGAGTAGAALVADLAELTGRDVAASDDGTGHAALGGNWALEVASGTIEADALDDAALGGDWVAELATFTVRNTSDGLEAPDTIASFTELAAWEDSTGERATLRDALLVAARTSQADTLVLVDDVYELGLGRDGEDSGRQGDLDITAYAVTITGAGADRTTIRMDGSDRVFDVLEGATLRLDELTVTGGNNVAAARDGGGIYVDENAFLVLTDAVVAGNAAGRGGGGVHIGEGATATIADSRITGNTAVNGGGASLGENASIYIQGSTIAGNTASVIGGGIALAQGAELNLENGSEVSGNTAGRDGGGIEAGEDVIVNVLSGSVVSGNEAVRRGGGISVDEGTIVNVTDSEISGNTAGQRGGGIDADRVNLSGATIADNSANGGKGGGLYARGEIDAVDVLFRGNDATDDGGAVHAHGGGRFERVTFALNDSGRDGGALSHHSPERLTLVNNTFSANTAQRGGALHVEGGDVDVVNATFFGNRADSEGGAVWAQEGAVTIGNSAFEGNATAGGADSIDVALGTVASDGFNVFDDTPALTLRPSDRTGIAAALEPLAAAGDALPTHRPGIGSPLIDAGGNVAHGEDASGGTLDEIPDIGARERSGADDIVYYVDDDSRILRVGGDLSHPQVIIDDAPRLVDVAVDIEGGRVYWLQDNGTNLGSSALDGSDRAGLLSTAPSMGATAIAVDPVGNHLVVAFREPLEIRRFELGNIVAPGELVVDTDVGGVVDIAVAGSGTASDPVRVYWADAGAPAVPALPPLGLPLPAVGEGIRSARVDGQNEDIRTHVPAGVLLGGSFEALSVTPDGSRAYWTDPARDRIGIVDLDSGAISSFVTGGDADPRGIATSASGDRVFWSSDTNDRLTAVGADLVADRVDENVDREVQAIDVGRTADTTVVNAPPRFESGSLALALDEGEGDDIDTGVIEIEDDDTAPEDIRYRFAKPANGDVYVDGVTDPVLTFTDAQLRAGEVRYVHDGSETTDDTLVLDIDDGTGNTLSRTIAITVTLDDDAPTLEVGTAKVLDGVPFELTTAELDGDDEESGKGGITYDIDSLPAHLTLSVAGDPSVTTFTHAQLIAGDVVIEHAYTGEADHAHSAKVVVRDGTGGAVLDTLSVEVAAHNADAPLGGADAIELFEGESSTRLVGDVPSVLDNDSDPQGPLDTLSVELFAAPLHGTIDLQADGTFRYEHDDTESPSDRFSYVAIDSAGQRSDPVEVSIDVNPRNDPPVLVGAVAAQSAPEGQPFRLPLPLALWSDPDPADTLTLEATLADGSPLPDWLVLSGADGAVAPDEPALAGTPGNADVGTLAIRVVARDADGVAATALTFALEVTDVNTAPGPITLSATAVDENHPGAAVGALAVADEDEGDTVTLTVDDPRFVVDGDGTLALAAGVSLDHESEPRVPIVVTATDAAGATSSAAFELLVGDLDDGPIARADAVAVLEAGVAETLEGGETSVLANDGRGAGDARVELFQGPLFGTLELAADGTFLYTHDGSENHLDAFDYTVRDASGQQSAPTTVTIVIEAANDAPRRVGDPIVARATEGEAFALAVGTDHWSDSDAGDTLALLVTRADGSPLPSWLRFDPASGVLSGTPSNADVGPLALAIEARDAAGAAAEPLALTLDVVNVNAAPSDITLEGDGVAENVPGAVIGRLDARDEDIGDVPRFSVEDPRFTIDGNTLALAPGAALDFEAEPVVEVVVTATDERGASHDERLTVTVLDRNDEPTARAPATPAALEVGDVYVVPPGTFTDADRDALSYSATRTDGGALPAWLRFEPETLSFTVIESAADGTADASDPSDDAVGVRLLADDGRGGRSFVDLAIRRVPALAPAEPEPPTLEPTPAGPASESPIVDPLPLEPPIVSVATPTASERAAAPATSEAPAAPAEATASDRAATIPSAGASPDAADRVEVEIATVDLASLIGERPSIGRLALASVDADFGPSDDGLGRTLELRTIDTVDLASLLGDADGASSRAFDGLSSAFESQREALEERATFARTLVGGSAGLTSGLSVGYLIWLIRGGTLMGSVLSSLPAWRFVDPLPVLGALADDVDGDDESLESIVADDHAPSGPGSGAAVTATSGPDAPAPSQPTPSDDDGAPRATG